MKRPVMIACCASTYGKKPDVVVLYEDGSIDALVSGSWTTISPPPGMVETPPSPEPETQEENPAPGAGQSVIDPNTKESDDVETETE